jgi:hypothetical protein
MFPAPLTDEQKLDRVKMLPNNTATMIKKTDNKNAKKQQKGVSNPKKYTNKIWYCLRTGKIPLGLTPLEKPEEIEMVATFLGMIRFKKNYQMPSLIT